jgi:hypothetical protein
MIKRFRDTYVLKVNAEGERVMLKTTIDNADGE